MVEVVCLILLVLPSDQAASSTSIVLVRGRAEP